MQRPWVKLAAIVLAIATLLSLPHLLWLALPSRALDVVILDKSVPFENYRGHAAIPWLLRAKKIREPDGHFLDAATEFVGFDPRTRTGRDLTAERLANADVLFVTDTYGVYQGDYAKPGDVASLERSAKIYGGTSDAEASAMVDFAARGHLILAEFNTFASPTGGAARAQLETLFGVRWTHWVARYWPDLQDHDEVPAWVGRNYERIVGKPFDLTGGALVFFKEDDDILVLRPGEDIGPQILNQIATATGDAYDFPSRGHFYHWVDVVVPTDGKVIAEHVVDATDAGAAKLAAHGLAARFPALTQRGTAWYFAGNYGDSAMDRGDPERIGILPFKNFSYRLGAHDFGQNGKSVGEPEVDERFFWRWYAPIVTRILDTRALNK